MVKIWYEHVFSDGSTTTSSISNLKGFSGVSNINNLYRTSMYTGLTSSTTGTVDLRRKTSLIFNDRADRVIYESTLYDDVLYDTSGRLSNPWFTISFDTVKDDDALTLRRTTSFTERVAFNSKYSTDQFSYATSRYIATYTTVSNIDTGICVLSRQYSTGSTVIGRYGSQQYTATGIGLTLGNSAGDDYYWTVYQLSSNKLTYDTYGYDNLTFSLTDTASYPSKTVTLDTSYDANKSATELLFTANSITLTCAISHNATGEFISADTTTVQSTASSYSIQLPDYPVGVSSKYGQTVITDNHYALRTNSNGNLFYNIYSDDRIWCSTMTLSIAGAAETTATILDTRYAKTYSYSWTPASPEVNDFLTSIQTLYNSKYVASIQTLESYVSTLTVDYQTVDNIKFYPEVAEKTTLNLRTIDTSSSVSVDYETVYTTLSDAGVVRLYYSTDGYNLYSTVRDNDATGAFSVYNITQTATDSKYASTRVTKTVTCDTYTTVDFSQTIFSRSSLTSRTMYSLAGSTVDFDVAVYTFTDNLTYSSRSAVSTITVQASSTSSNYDVAETVIDKNNYTYLTTFYGSLVGNNVSTTSWVNSAIVSTTTGQSWLDTYVDYSATYKTFGYPGAKTTASIVDYDKISPLTSASISREISASKTMVYTSSYKDSISNNYSSTTYVSITSTTFYSFTNPNITVADQYYGTYTGTFTASESGSYGYWADSSSYSEYNTSDYGTTARISDLIKSSSYVNLYDTYGVQNYYYEYDVDSIWKYEDQVSSTLKNYTTALATSFTFSYSTKWNYNSYSATKSTSLAGVSTGDRFIDRVEISRTYTSSYDVSNTVAYYNGSTLDTISSRTSINNTASEQDVSTVSRTFISSTGDLTTASSVISSDTETVGRGSFVYSSRELVASTSEQQNDTLIFASTFNTYSFYNSSYTTSTLNTVENTLSATTYEDWYNPVSWTETVLSIATSTGTTETVVTNSGVVSVTQSISFTPVYSTVDGIYVTA